MDAPLPRRIAWFAPWTWSLRLQIALGVPVVFLVMIGFVIGLWALLPIDIYINDIYIPSWR